MSALRDGDASRAAATARAGGVWTAVAGNGIGALLGLGQGLVVVRALGVTEYGVYGMLAAVAAICTNAFDLRLGDATMRWFYARRGDGLATLLAGALGQAVVASLLAVSTVLAAVALLSWLGTGGLPVWAVLAFAAGEAATYLAGFLVYSLRLSGGTRDLVRCEVTVAATRAAIVCTVVLIHPELAGLALALALAGAASLTIASASFFRVWVVAKGLRTSAAAVRAEIGALVGRRRELVSLHRMNYQNLLHRAADVLVVALVAGEREAGLYKLARSLTDNLYVLYDAMAKAHQPRLVELFTAGSIDELRSFAARTMRRTAVAVLVLLALEAVFLEPLLVTVFGAGFAPARVPILLLSGATFFVFGLYLWAWPLIVAERRVAAYAGTSFLAVVVGQYALAMGGVLAGVESAASCFALGYLASYLLLWAAFAPTAAALLQPRDPIGVAVSVARGRP